MFCQDATKKTTLSSVTTFKMSQQILQASKYDQILCVRLSSINDLIASEGKYHGACYMQFIRCTTKSKEKSKKTDIAMQWLINELMLAGGKGHVLEFSEVWKRYCDLTELAGIEIPQSYISRRYSFKEKLEPHVRDVYEFIPMANQAIENRQMLLIPVKFTHVPISEMASEGDESFPMPVYQHQQDNFLEMVHVALKLRSDIMAQPVYKGFKVTEDEAISCVPDNLFMFIRLLIGGQRLLDTASDENDDVNVTINDSKVQTIVLSIAQDLVYNASGGKHWTPKHVGLASTLHQATRSKELVQLFHNAGHIISYDNVLQVDTALAENTLKSMDEKTGAVTPPNFVPARFVHFSCDNIDINDSNLDGKDSFHATQVAGWQRGPPEDMASDSMQPSKTTTLKVPQVMEEIFPAQIVEGKIDPSSTMHVQKDWYDQSVEDKPEYVRGIASDMAFVVKRQNGDEIRIGWIDFNKQNTSVNSETTTVGYMPIVQAPAHEMDTLNTVVQRCKHVASSLGNNYVVLTVDEALYCKLMELKWAKEEYQQFLIVRLGGLHTSMNFLKVIGQHIQSSGLQDAWVESNMIGPRAAEQVMAGKSYNRGIRAHKLTFQAMWRILLPQLQSFIGQNNQQLNRKMEAVVADDNVQNLITLLETKDFRDAVNAFVASKDNANFQFWWSYMQMVEVLLLYIRAQRDGIWNLHLHAFKSMLPFFMQYDHTNYARWGTIYLSEMNQLPSEVELEFQNGNFVVKKTSLGFNQVDPDQSQEWLNAIGKKGGGIIGVTKTPTALSRWALSYNLRSHIACETREMFSVGRDDTLAHNECTRGRQKLDNQDEENLMKTLARFNLFSGDMPTNLQNIATKDLATSQIEDDLLNARQKGQRRLITFVEERLLPSDERKVQFHDPLRKNKSLTFAALYDTIKKTSVAGKEKVLKADRSILQRLITAYQSGRKVNLDEILHHELLPVPIALAEMDGSLRSGSKAVLFQVLTADVACPTSLAEEELGDSATLIIDGQALVKSIGKPQAASTFGDFTDIFVNIVLQSGAAFDRIDIVFDRYYKLSIKAQTRQRRTRGTRPIRRVIEGPNVPLPANWDNFMALPENKADLCRFLSEQLIAQAPTTKTVVAAGGFDEEEKVESSNPNVDVMKLQARHEEADTRIIVHCVQNQSGNIVVQARDTDVLILLLAHYHKFSCDKLWLKAGTAKKRKYIPVHTMVENMPYGPTILENMLAFHALTGSDTTSYISGHSKKTSWKVFQQHHELLSSLGKYELDHDTANDAESFFCRLYNIPNVDSVDKVRAILFTKSHTPESLPPTHDALLFHIRRCHYQAAIWRQAHINFPVLPSPDTMGWRQEEGALRPVLMSLAAVPESCLELISCGCTKGCKTLRCKCRKSQLPCTAICKCSDSDDTCFNSARE